MRHRQPKGSETDRPVLNHRVTSRLYTFGVATALQEIRELLLIEDGESGGCSHVRDLIAAKSKQVRAKIVGLRQIERRLEKAQKQCSAALTKSCNAECPVLQELESGREKGSK